MTQFYILLAIEVNFIFDLFSHHFNDIKNAKVRISRVYCLADEKLVDLLIKHGANINSVNSDKQTPLHKSASIGNVPTAELLIKAGADINQADQNDCTPIYLSIMHSNEYVFGFYKYI